MSGCVFSGGRIVSMEPRAPRAEVLVVEDGRVVACGGRELLAAHAHLPRRDLGGRLLLPGFIDAHYHLCFAALYPRWVDLSDARSAEDVRAALRDQAAREPDAAWVRGAQWDRAKVPLTRADLDALDLGRPAMVAHFSMHACVVCSRGLEQLEIGRGTPDPPGGEIVRGPDGEATGVLLERASSEAQAASIAPYTDPDRWAEHIEAHARLLLRDGVTCVHDAACPPAAEDAYRRLAAAGGLPLSVLAMPHPAALFGSPEAERLEGPLTGEGDELLRVGPIKLFADGGAHPGVDAHLGARRIRTGFVFPGLVEDVARASERGFRVAIHAMGNAGVSSALDALRGAIRRDDRDHRPRIEHATLLSEEQARELGELGAVGVVQPGFVEVMGPDVEHLDFDDALWLPFATLADAGLPLAGSSDAPCAVAGPVTTSCVGVSRRTPSGGILGAEQAIAYEDWMRAYTVGAAYAGGQEDERGSLRPGKRADLAILEGELDAERPPRVVETWVGGERAWATEPEGTGAAPAATSTAVG